MTEQPNRTPWLLDEMLRLNQLLDAGLSIPDIAKRLDRSENETATKAAERGATAKPKRKRDRSKRMLRRARNSSAH